MSRDFVASLNPPDPGHAHALWFIFSGYRLLVATDGNRETVPLAARLEEFAISTSRPIFFGTHRGIPCYGAAADGKLHTPAGAFSFEELRSLFGRLEDSLYAAALTAIHLIEWDLNSRFCGKCRASVESRTDMRAKECPECKHLEFPRISPAIIVLIEKDNTILLARSSRFPAAFYSVLAGFVEPGESLEQAVHREVMEETGIGVKDIRYFGSQPWPFPDSLMIGFTACYESGEIRIDGEEIVEAGWFSADNLPELPGRLSIARQLIDWFVEKRVTGDW